LSRPALREGFTTGTAAAAAAYAAVRLLGGAAVPDLARVALPPFTPGEDERRPAARRLDIAIEQGGRLAPDAAWASVIKDGGDDPDATHGARIMALASCTPPRPDLPALLSRRDRPSPWPPELPSPRLSPAAPLVIAGRGAPVALYGGTGIGVASLPGLPVAVGEPAINPQPRLQIAEAAAEAAETLGYAGPLHLVILAPDGEERARHTLNARLGIIGGISILGTRGIVRPYSHEAWTGTIDEALSVAEALGITELLCSTGRRSERLGFALFPHLPPQAGVQVADYAAHALRGAARGRFRQVHWLCFPGKLLKLAQGLEWTHAKAGTADIPLLARLCRECGGTRALAAAVTALPTANGVFDALAEHDAALRDRVLEHLAGMALAVMRRWLHERGPGPALTLHVFDARETLLLERSG
jgi:cobalt-precorrin-5B (C1)-methyltransferase